MFFSYELEVIFNQTWLNRSRTKNLIRREDTICATKCWFLLRNMGNPLDKHLKKCSYRLQFSQAVKRLFVCIFLSLKMFPHSFTIFLFTSSSFGCLSAYFKGKLALRSLIFADNFFCGCCFSRPPALVHSRVVKQKVGRRERDNKKKTKTNTK